MNQLSAQKSGFTLIEMLIAIALFGLLGTIATTSLFNFLGGSAKSEIVKELKQTGDYAVSNMELKIRNARNASISSSSTCSGSGSGLKILNPDNTTTEFACTSGVLTEQVVVAPSPQPTPVAAQLTSQKVTVSACAFSCSENSFGNQTVTISFTLSQSAIGAPVVESATETFRTQVTLRSR